MDKEIKDAFDKAKEYNSKSKFKKECGKEYRLLNKLGLFEKASEHMPKINRTDSRKWTYDKCREIAKKYTSKKDFSNGNRGAYRAASKYGWLEELTKDYETLGNKYKRCIYVFEFSDKSVYVGLTYDPKKRFWQHHHERNSKVYAKINESNEEPVFKIITDFLSYEVAGEKECETINSYKKDGWKILNERKGGSLGGLSSLKWDKEKCLEEAKKYKNVTSLYRNNNSCYMFAKKNGFLDELFDLLGRVSHKKWTYDDALKEAKKYEYLSEFIDKSGGCFQVSLRNGWLETFDFLKRKFIKEHSIEEFSKIAIGYKNISEMRNSDNKLHRSYAYWVKINKLQKDVKKYFNNGDI